MTDGPTIAVFGSSEPKPGDERYRVAREVGGLLAGAGMRVLTGAYGGVMEGASRGAREAGGIALGVGCAVFSTRRPNRFLTALDLAPDLFERTRRLIDRADGFVVLPGKTGTLAELSMLWALDRAGCLGPRPVVLLGDRWIGILDRLSTDGVLDQDQRARTPLALSPHEALGWIVRDLGNRG